MLKARKGQYIMGAVSLLSNEFNQFGEHIISGLTYKQWFLLMMISRMEESENTVNAIADFVGTSRQNIKKMLVPLGEKGFVNVKKSKSDARALSVCLTKQAYAFFKENDARVAAATEELLSPLTEEEVDALTNGLKKLMHCYDEYNGKMQNR